jgi:hypothetical protein
MPDSLTVPDSPAEPFGPFLTDCSPTERAFWFGLLTAFAHCYCGGDNPVSASLTRAAFGTALERAVAFDTLNTMPALPKRKVLGSFARRVRPDSRTITNGKARKGAA